MVDTDTVLELMDEFAAQDNWISVEDGLPEMRIEIVGNLKSINVLAVDDDGDIVIAYVESVRPTFEVKVWAVSESDREINVVKWQYLPPVHAGKNEER